MSPQPMIVIAVDSYVGAFAAIGFMLPICIASLAAGYILMTFVYGRLAKTHLGIALRHWFTRLAPSKFYDEDYISDGIRD